MSEVIIKQLVDNEGNPIAGLTPEAAVYDQNGARLNNKLENIDGQVAQLRSDLADKISYKGVATPSTNPGTPDYNVFYLACGAGTYANFGGIIISTPGLHILKYNGSAWVAEKVVISNVPTYLFFQSGTPDFVSDATYNGSTLTLSFGQNIGIGATPEGTASAWIPKQSNLVLGHGVGLWIDTLDNTLKTGDLLSNVSTVFIKTNILLGVHLYGRFSSPYPILQREVDAKLIGTKGLKIDATSPIGSKLSYLDSMGVSAVENDIAYSPISNNPIFNNVNPWSLATWVTNTTEFKLGSYFAQLNGTNGAANKIIIPENQKVVGRKMKVILTYKSNVSFRLAPQFMTSSNAWIDATTGYSLSKTLAASTEETTVTIERPYVATAHFFVPLIDNIGAGNPDIKISSVVLFATGDLYIPIQDSLTFLNRMQMEYVRISDNYFFTGESPFAPGLDAHTMVANSGEFTLGKYYAQFTSMVPGTSFYIPIPDKYRKVGAKLKLTVVCKNTQAFNLITYFRDTNNSNWVNNSGAATTIISPSKTEQQITIERKYEAGVGYFAFYSGSSIASCDIKIGYVSLFIENANFSDLIVKTNEIVVDAAGGGDFTNLRDALKSITDASENNRYHVLIKNGTYNEIDIAGANYHGSNKDVVVIEGQSRDGVIIRTDGLSTALSPVDYNKDPATYGGIPINTIPQAWKHTFWLITTCTIKNLTVHANDVKYCVHQDSSGNYDSLFDNCMFIHEENTSYFYGNIIGIGSRYKQYQRYHNCIFEFRCGISDGISESSAVYWHNWNNQAGSTGLELKNCKCINCHILFTSDLGSNHDDVLIVDGCSTNLKTRGIKYTLSPGYYTPTPSTENDYPYNIRLLINGGNISFFNLPSNRSEAGLKALAQNDYHQNCYNRTGSTIQIGYAIKVNYADMTYGKNTIIKATDNDFDGVAWRDIANNTEGYFVPKKKTVQVFALANTYTKGDMLKVNASGQFEKTLVVAEKIAIVTDSITIGSNGLIKAYLI